MCVILITNNLRSFSVILLFSISSIIESLITSLGSTTFIRGNGTSLVSRVNLLHDHRNQAERLVSNQQILGKASFTIAIPNHVLACEFPLLWSGRRFVMHVCRTNRDRNSFIPPAIPLINSLGRELLT